jgi:hypothetical protein
MVWLSLRTPQDLKDFPLIASWGIWLAQNSTPFQDEPQSPLHVAINCLGILAHLKPVVRMGLGIARRVQVEQIDKGWPWDFFDGAASEDHLLCGEGCLRLSAHYFFLLKAGLGGGTNNYSKIMALKLLILFAMEKGCKTLQVFRDSLLIINWVN